MNGNLFEITGNVNTDEVDKRLRHWQQQRDSFAAELGQHNERIAHHEIQLTLKRNDAARAKRELTNCEKAIDSLMQLAAKVGGK